MDQIEIVGSFYNLRRSMCLSESETVLPPQAAIG